MSLNVSKLEKARELAGGIVQARCPACAEAGGDRKGEHLRVYPDGRFGCCVHPKDREHRKRIFALVGDRSSKGQFAVNVGGGVAPAASPHSVRKSLRNFLGTLGTPENESENAVPSVPAPEKLTVAKSWDAWDGSFSPSRVCARESVPVEEENSIEKLKGSELPVPSVPAVPRVLEEGTGKPLPHFTPGGTLVIPFDSPKRFHWWAGGQSVAETKAEVERWRQEAKRKEQHGTGV